MVFKIKQKRTRKRAELINLAWNLYQVGNFRESIHICEKILEDQPGNFDALSLAGRLSYQIKKYDAAIKYFEKALIIKPDDANTYNNLGLSFQEQGKLDEAVIYYEKATQLDSNLDAAYYNLGNTFKDKGKLVEAITCYQRALQLNPDYTQVYTNLAVAFRRNGMFNEAVACHQKVLQLNPNDAEEHSNLALTYLTFGNFREGWQEHEWRWKTEYFRQYQRSFSQPLWDGLPLNGKTLLIYSEQGVGDEIMFASCLQDAIEQIGVCIVECDKRLIPIFSRSFPKAAFIERVKNTDDYLSQLPQTDMAISIGSLPKFFRNDFNAFPRKSYLIPDVDRVCAWRNRLKILGEGLKIGISWRGGTQPIVKLQRSMKLEQWDRLFSLSGIHFINLQYGDCEKELREAKDKLNVTVQDWEDIDPLKDLDNFAAQISALDLVISVDNSTVHMAGGLGRRVCVLLPFSPDWRWMLNREDSPWYPTVRLFRQPSPGDWESVIVKVKDELLKLLESN
jgi:tetratricopeptide (TPR) repeat protein